MGLSSEIVGPVEDGGPWQGPTEEEWTERIARQSTPAGETIPWIKRDPRRNDVPDAPAAS